MDELPRVRVRLPVQPPEVEVEESEEEDVREVEVPCAVASAPSGGACDGEGGIVECSLQEELLPCELYLDDELLAVGGGAEEVEACPAVLGGVAELLELADFEVRDVESEDGVEGPDQQVLLAGLLEDLSS